MRALRLSEYISVFKERDIQGSELVYLNRTALRVSKLFSLFRILFMEFVINKLLLVAHILIVFSRSV